jgi:hypothetical protein
MIVKITQCFYFLLNFSQYKYKLNEFNKAS